MKHPLHKGSILLVIFCVLYLVISFYLMTHESLTFDEPINIQEGINNVVRQSYEIEPYNPPLVRTLAVLPLVLTGTTHGEMLPQGWKIILARLVIVGLGLCLLVVVYVTAKRYGGTIAASIATCVLLFDPQILAHSHYITPDIGSTLFFFLTWIMYINLIKHPTMKRWIAVGMLCGMTMASKIPVGLFLFVSIVFYLLCIKRTTVISWVVGEWRGIMMALCILSLVVWSLFSFRFAPVIAPSEHTNRVSHQLINYANAHKLYVLGTFVQILRDTPLPLGDYLALVKNTVLRGNSNRIEFFLGEFQSGKPYFLPVIYVLKTPIPLLLLYGYCLLYISYSWLQRTSKHLHVDRVQFSSDKTNIVGVFALPVVMVLFISYLINTPALVRYLLPIIPFMAVIIGITSASFVQSRWKMSIGLLLLAWYIIGTVKTFPHPLIFTNELLSNETQRMQFLHDSNVDWGQGLISLRSFVDSVKPERIRFSYFGRDNASRYGFISSKPWGSYTAQDICAFHDISFPENTGKQLTVISVTNWHGCGYADLPDFSLQQLQRVVGGSLLVFETP